MSKLPTDAETKSDLEFEGACVRPANEEVTIDGEKFTIFREPIVGMVIVPIVENDEILGFMTEYVSQSVYLHDSDHDLSIGSKKGSIQALPPPSGSYRIFVYRTEDRSKIGYFVYLGIPFDLIDLIRRKRTNQKSAFEAFLRKWC